MSNIEELEKKIKQEKEAIKAEKKIKWLKFKSRFKEATIYRYNRIRKYINRIKKNFVGYTNKKEFNTFVLLYIIVDIILKVIV